MTDPPARLRSILFTPGDNERALEKARELPADGLILDLEDAVAPGSKEAARERVCRAVASGGYGNRLLAVRVNSAGSAWHDADLRAAAAAGPDAIVVPKVGSADQVRAIEAALAAAGAPETTRIWAMLESPAAVLGAREIAAASERLTVLVMGTNDLTKELRAEELPGREGLLTSLSLCLLAARAAGKAILDGVFNDLQDLPGFEAECNQGRRLGFDGKTLIHPRQLDICNRVFSPSEAEVQQARRVIDAFERAAKGGAAVATVDGRMVESMHVETARRVLSVQNGAA